MCRKRPLTTPADRLRLRLKTRIEEPIAIDASPEDLARPVMTTVTVVEDKE